MMVDTGTVRRPGQQVLNAATGTSSASSTLVYSGRCWIRQASAVEREVLFGEEQVTTTRFMACFPHSVTGVRVGDIVTVTASDDVDVLGRSFRVLAIPMSTYPLYKGFACEVVE